VASWTKEREDRSQSLVSRDMPNAHADPTTRRAQFTEFPSVDDRRLKFYSSLLDAGYMDEEFRCFSRFFTRSPGKVFG